MESSIRKWRIDDKADLAENLNNKNILDNLRDGLPYPYTEKDAEEFIKAMLSADTTMVVRVIGAFSCLKSFS